MSTNLIAGIVFVAVFGVVILVHELGHFIVGRLFKIDIEEFGIGMPPKMLTLFTWQGTDFTLNWLPFGGFNRFKGEDSLEEKDPQPGELNAASPWVRLAVLLAGAVMNLILGVLVYGMIFSQTGIPDFERVQVYEVTPGSPADEAGFRENDILLKMNGELITSDIQMRTLTKENLDQMVQVTLLRDGEEIETNAMPLSSRTAEEGAFGFLPGFSYNATPSITETIIHSTEMTYLHARELLLLPGRMLRGSISPEEGRFIGFKGIFNIFQQTISADMESRVESEPTTTTTTSPATEESSPTFFTLSMIANLTITLGVFNLLPFPALDGGRIFFLLPELFFRKRVPARFEGVIHWAGMMLLLGLMFYINIMDFVNPVNISFP